MYSIDNLCPTGGMGGHGFVIHLSQQFKEMVAKADLEQEQIDRVLNIYGPEWMVKTGFNHYFDPENCGQYHRTHAIPSKETKLSDSYLRVAWGEWGPEHITVPGNACGLDVERGVGCVFDNGKMLVPHNVDSWNQKCLLLLVFTWFANSVFWYANIYKEEDDEAKHSSAD